MSFVKGDSSTPDVIDDGKEVKAVSINVNQAELSLKVGASYAIVPEVLPSNTTNKEVTYKSADEKIAWAASTDARNSWKNPPVSAFSATG